MRSCYGFVVAFSWLLFVITVDAYVSYHHRKISRLRHQDSSNSDFEKRKAEIQRKITELKRAGKLKRTTSDNGDDSAIAPIDIESLTGLERIKAQREQLKRKGSVMDDYSDQLQDRLGRKARYLGIDVSSKSAKKTPTRKAQLGSLAPFGVEDRDTGIDTFDADVGMFVEDEDDDDDEYNEDDLTEQNLIDLVDEKLRQKRAQEREEEEERLKVKLEKLRFEREQQESATNDDNTKLAPPTSGIGGAYVPNATAAEELRRPSRGSWGYFERPKDISKAYGGGRRIGAGYMKEVDREASYEQTRERMKEYRIKMGIDVQSETDHAIEIDEAVKIAKLGMERGMYSTAVSALEKVTQWCSSNSKVGSTVFLELAMAYEAIGRTDEASQVYKKLSTCRIDDVKNNAKRLLYRLESFEFMRTDAKLASFNRKQIRTNFIETTRMDDFLSNFDDVYNTAYVDTSSREYKRLTENVVRSVREARQILLKATNVGMVERTKVIQALRSVARTFDEAMQRERKAIMAATQPVAMIDGVAIVSKKQDESGYEDFTLLSPEQMIDNLNGEWRLQLIADRTGNGVSFFNNTISWQILDTDAMAFDSQGVVGFLSVSEIGDLEFDGERRILRRAGIESVGGGGMLASFLGPKGGAASNKVAQQIMTVDSILLVTRCAEAPRWQDEDKQHFAVWRKVEPGTYPAIRRK